jgi:hypothetical protein
MERYPGRKRIDALVLERAAIDERLRVARAVFREANQTKTVLFPSWWTPSDEPDTCRRIPVGVWHLVINELPRFDALNLRETCKFFNGVIMAHASLWDRRTMDDYRVFYRFNKREALADYSRQIGSVRAKIESRTRRMHTMLDETYYLTLDLVSMEERRIRIRENLEYIKEIERPVKKKARK